MIKITQFDRQNLALLTNRLKQALAPLEAEFGITLSYKGARFSAENATFKVEGAVISTGGVIVTKERTNFPLFCYEYGMTPDMLNGECMFRGELYTIVGISPRRSKFPIHAKRVSDGKTYLITAASAVAGYRKPVSAGV